MARLKIKVNQPPIRPEEVKRYRDFGGLMEQHKKYYTPSGIRYMFLHEKRKLVYIVLIVIFILLMLFSDVLHAQRPQQPVKVNQKPVIISEYDQSDFSGLGNRQINSLYLKEFATVVNYQRGGSAHGTRNYGEL